jgi:hypothetical protein
MDVGLDNRPDDPLGLKGAPLLDFVGLLLVYEGRYELIMSLKLPDVTAQDHLLAVADVGGHRELVRSSETGILI